MFKVKEFFGERKMHCTTCEDKKFIKDSDGESVGYIDCPDCGNIEEFKQDNEN